MYISVTIKPPSGGTCSKGSLYSLLEMAHVIMVHYKAFLCWYMYSRDTIKPPSDGTDNQGSLLSILVMIHVLKRQYKDDDTCV